MTVLEGYLGELATKLPQSSLTREMLDETRDHLLEATAAFERAGAAREMAERQAVTEFGAIDQLVAEFRAVADVGEARRQARRQTLLAVLLSALSVALFWTGQLLQARIVDAVLHPLAILVALVTMLGPALLLFALSRLPRTWRPGGWQVWLGRVLRAARWLLVPGLICGVALVCGQTGMVLGASHVWLALAAVVGGAVAGLAARQHRFVM
jgi:hypothetical protein